MEKMSSVRAIKTFFELDGGREVTMTELKDLGAEARTELGALAAVELGVELSSK